MGQVGVHKVYILYADQVMTGDTQKCQNCQLCPDYMLLSGLSSQFCC